MVKCPYCQKVYVENTLFCSECGNYLVEHEGRKTDPLDTDELIQLAEQSEEFDIDFIQEHKVPPLAVQLKIGPKKRVIEASVRKPLQLGRVDPTSNVFPDIDVSEEGEEAHSVSRRHARILWQSNSLVVEDLGSINGTFLNGKRLDPYMPEPLHDGDVIYLGKVMVEVKILRQ